MHKVTCADCGNEAEVPFKPKEDRPVYCRECFQKHRKPRTDRRFQKLVIIKNSLVTNFCINYNSISNI